MTKNVFDLLHLSDPNLPIGGFSHSFGLETFVQKEIVTDKESFKRWLTQMTLEVLPFNDALFLRFAFESLQKNEAEKLDGLNHLCHVTKSPKEPREASLKMGKRLLKIFNKEIDYTGDLELHHSIAFAVIAFHQKFDLKESLEAYFFNSIIGFITNGVKLVPLSQNDGQALFFELKTSLKQGVEITLKAKKKDLGRSSLLLDFACIEHESLYSRLYMS